MTSKRRLVHFIIALSTFGIGVLSSLPWQNTSPPSVVGISLNEVVVAKEKLPTFEDYPVYGVYRGKPAPLKLTREERRSAYGVRLQYTIENYRDVDFAGRYIVANWSCGMWCSWNAIIDAKTGKVYGWNGDLSPCFPHLDKDFACNEDFSNVEYKIDSKLIIFFGNRGDNGIRGFHYYKFENGRLIHLMSIPVKEQRSWWEMRSEEAGKLAPSESAYLRGLFYERSKEFNLFGKSR